jgi:sporulation integral membrane protein YtvI
MYGKQYTLLYRALCCGLVLVGLWLFGRYVAAWIAPFVVAFGLAAAIEPGVRLLIKNRWPRSLASGVITILVIGLGVMLMVWGLTAAGRAISQLSRAVPKLVEGLIQSAKALQGRLTHFLTTSEAAGETVDGTLELITQQLETLPGLLSEKLLAWVSAAAAGTPGKLLFAVTSGIGAYFISASYPEIRSFLFRQLPAGEVTRAQAVWADLKKALGSWVRAQVLMGLLTFGELLVAFTLLRRPEALPLAAVVAAVDALPVLGTGTILIPWLLYAFVTGETTLGLGLLITYAVVTLVRRCVEAKLVGDQLGLHPVATLIAIYVGYRVWGILGMLIFPIFAVLLKQLNDRGVIRLWKNEDNGCAQP